MQYTTLIPIKVSDDDCINIVYKWIESFGIIKSNELVQSETVYRFTFDALIKQFDIVQPYTMRLDIAFTQDNKHIIYDFEGFKQNGQNKPQDYDLPQDSPIIKLFQNKFVKINFGDQRPKGNKKTFLKLKRAAFGPGLESETENSVNDFLNYCGAFQIPNDWK